MSQHYDYVNDLGYHKRLTVEFPKRENGKYFCSLWSRDTGDCCGTGDLTENEIEEMLSHYGLHFNMGN